MKVAGGVLSLAESCVIWLRWSSDWQSSGVDSGKQARVSQIWSIIAGRRQACERVHVLCCECGQSKKVQEEADPPSVLLQDLGKPSAFLRGLPPLFFISWAHRTMHVTHNYTHAMVTRENSSFGFFWRKSGLLLYRRKVIFVNRIEVREELQAALLAMTHSRTKTEIILINKCYSTLNRCGSILSNH